MNKELGLGQIRHSMVFPKVTRVEVIDAGGRVFAQHYTTVGVEVALQDRGSTVKIFAGQPANVRETLFQSPLEDAQLVKEVLDWAIGASYQIEGEWSSGDKESNEAYEAERSKIKRVYEILRLKQGD